MSEFINPTEAAWRAHNLRVQGEFFDLEDLSQWQLALDNNRILCAKDWHFDVDDSPTSDDNIATKEAQNYRKMNFTGRTHLALSLPRDDGDIENMNKLYLYAADMIEKHDIKNVTTITSGSFFDHRPEKYPYLVLWFTRPIE